MSNDHIPKEETEAEIIIMKREIAGLELLGDKLSMFKADGKKYGIKEREEFIKRLKTILTKRQESKC